MPFVYFQQIPAIWVAKYLQAYKNEVGQKYVHMKNKRHGYQKNPPKGRPSDDQLEVRNAFSRCAACFGMQPYSGGAPDPSQGPVDRSWWFNAAAPSGLWYYDYFIQQTWQKFFDQEMPTWCRKDTTHSYSYQQSYYSGVINGSLEDSWITLVDQWIANYWLQGNPLWAFNNQIDSYQYRQNLASSRKLTIWQKNCAFGFPFHTLTPANYGYVWFSLTKYIPPGAAEESAYDIQFQRLDDPFAYYKNYWGPTYPNIINIPAEYTPTLPETRYFLLVIPWSQINPTGSTAVSLGRWFSWGSPTWAYQQNDERPFEGNLVWRETYTWSIIEIGSTDVPPEVRRGG